MSDDTDTGAKTQVPQLHLDYESRSRVDLLKYGAYNYAQSPSTELHCFSWAFDDEPPQNWHPPMPLPERVLAHFKACQAAKGDPLHPYARSIHAHNAAFERLMTWFVLCVDYPEAPEPPLEAFYCTAAQARARALPGGLDNLGTALQLRTRKDKRGKELIKLLCVPDAYGNFNEDPELLQELYDYCDTDVVVERDAEKMTPPLTEDEWLDYLVSERINDYGIRVDVEFCCAAQRYAEPEKDAINAEISEMTDGAVKSARSFPSLKTWIAPFRETNEIIRKATTKVKTDRRTKEETRKITLDKGARHNILSAEEESPGSIPAVVAGLVSLLDEAGRTSISKYASMARRANDDERVCGAYVYCGAGQTHRFSSTGLQVHNYTRDCSKEPEIVRAEVLDGSLALTANKPEWSILDILASMLRPTIIAAPGRRLVWGDWSAVEARVTPWLANSTGANVILDIFRSGQDIYVHEAAKIYNTTPENIDPKGDQRQIGKVAELSLGFGGGMGALLAMARNYGVKLTPETAARVVAAWREANPWARDYWSASIKAAKQAVRYPGEYFQAGRINYVCVNDAHHPVLYAVLPDATILAYPKIALENIETKFGPSQELTYLKASWKPKADEPGWPRAQLWHGTLVENAVQGTAAALLRRALRRLYAWDWDCIAGHTHDDIMLEPFADEVDDAKAALVEAMMFSEPWQEGLPLAVDVKDGERLRK